MTALIHIVSESDYWNADKLRRDAAKAAGESDQDYEIWARYHQSLVELLRKYGDITDKSTGRSDFYHSGDWFNSLKDTFVLRAPKPLTKINWDDLRAVVALRSAHAALSLGGEIDGVLGGLEIFVTPQKILAWWRDKSSRETYSMLRKYKCPVVE